MKKLFAVIALALSMAACSNAPYAGPGSCNSATTSMPNCGNGGGSE